MGGWKDKVCLKHAIDCDVNFPVVNLSEYTGWGSSADNGTFQPLFSIKEDLSYFRGKHNLKFGYQFDAQHANGFGQQNIGGVGGLQSERHGGSGVHDVESDQWRQLRSPRLLLGWVNNSSTETVRFVSQRYPYHGFYAQDDWRVTRKLTINIGLRYDVTHAAGGRGRQVRRLHADKPNPAVNNYPGALRFAGDGAGREGRAAWCRAGTAAGARASASPTRPIRRLPSASAFGRSFSRVTVVGSSGHYDGFARIYTNSTPDSGITPAFLVDAGPSIPYVLPPVIDPTHQQQQRRAPLAAAGRGARAGSRCTGRFRVQRQITPNTVVEAGYNATIGTHLQTGNW